MGERKIKIPAETFTNLQLKEHVRKYPSLECLSDFESRRLDGRVGNLKDFEISAKTSSQVVEYISKFLKSKYDFSEKDVFESKRRTRKQKYFFKDPWEEGSMIIVKEGQLPIENGFHVLLCHSDSPYLKIKSTPIKIETDENEVYNFLGVRLSGVPHGGLSVHQWAGQQVIVYGYSRNSKGEKRFIEFPAVVGDYSSHIDYRGEEKLNEAFEPEKTLEIIPGQRDLKELLDSLQFESADNFGESKLCAVPTNKPLTIDEYTWRLLVGYGHDDRVCVFSAVDAIAKARKPKYTSVVWMTDSEEVGNQGPSGEKGPFFDVVLDKILRKDISESKRRLMYFNSSLIVADVFIAPFGHDADNMDYRSAAKIGLGVALPGEEGLVSDTRFSLKLRNLARKEISRGRNLCFQRCGNFYSQNNEEWITGELGNFASKFGQWAYVGIPCASTHSPNEIICPGDEYWTSRFYRRFLESEISLENKNKR